MSRHDDAVWAAKLHLGTGKHGTLLSEKAVREMCAALLALDANFDSAIDDAQKAYARQLAEWQTRERIAVAAIDGEREACARIVENYLEVEPWPVTSRLLADAIRRREWESEVDCGERGVGNFERTRTVQAMRPGMPRRRAMDLSEASPLIAHDGTGAVNE